MAPAAVVAALLAQFNVPQDCDCSHGPAWAVVVELHGDAGASLVKEARRLNAPPSDAFSPAQLANFSGPEGKRYFFAESSFMWREVDDHGVLRCDGLYFNAVDWAQAVTDGTCRHRAQAAGFKYPDRCRDVAGCSAADGAFALPLLLVLLRRRRAVPVSADP